MRLSHLSALPCADVSNLQRSTHSSLQAMKRRALELPGYFGSSQLAREPHNQEAGNFGISKQRHENSSQVSSRAGRNTTSKCRRTVFPTCFASLQPRSQTRLKVETPTIDVINLILRPRLQRKSQRENRITLLTSSTLTSSRKVTGQCRNGNMASVWGGSLAPTQTPM